MPASDTNTDELDGPTTPPVPIFTPGELHVLEPTPAPPSSADPRLARLIAFGLLLIGGALLAGLLAVAAFANGIPTEARVAALTAVSTAAAGAIGAAAALLTRTH